MEKRNSIEPKLIEMCVWKTKKKKQMLLNIPIINDRLRIVAAANEITKEKTRAPYQIQKGKSAINKRQRRRRKRWWWKKKCVYYFDSIVLTWNQLKFTAGRPKNSMFSMGECQSFSFSRCRWLCNSFYSALNCIDDFILADLFCSVSRKLA